MPSVQGARGVIPGQRCRRVAKRSFGEVRANVNLVERREGIKHADNPEALQREQAGIVSEGGLVG